jgi:hypothetical protein
LHGDAAAQHELTLQAIEMLSDDVIAVNRCLQRWHEFATPDAPSFAEAGEGRALLTRASGG